MAAENLKFTAQDALTQGIIERIIEEYDIGEDSFYAVIRDMLSQEMDALLASDNLLNERYDRFRRIGAPDRIKD